MWSKIIIKTSVTPVLRASEKPDDREKLATAEIILHKTQFVNNTVAPKK